MMTKQLTGKRAAFVDAYLGPAAGNATEAARIAGYAVPMQEGHRLLRNAEVAAAVAERTRARGMESDEVLERLAAIARFDLRRAFTWDPDARRYVLDPERAKASGLLAVAEGLVDT